MNNELCIAVISNSKELYDDFINLNTFTGINIKFLSVLSIEQTFGIRWSAYIILHYAVEDLDKILYNLKLRIV